MPPSDPIYRFDDADHPLSLVPTAARRALDLAGIKLSLEGWRSLGRPDRMALVTAGAAPVIDIDLVRTVVVRASPAAEAIAPQQDPDPVAPPGQLLEALRVGQDLSAETWASLSPLDRYALSKVGRRGPSERLDRAYEEIVKGCLSHLTSSGEARMVAIGAKPVSARRAVASARILMKPETHAVLVAGNSPKGDVLAAARIAGIQAAKRTWELIPLCHPIALTAVDLVINHEGATQEGGSRASVLVRATVQALDRTGVEMEALVAASTAALTIYDMLKSIDRWMTIADIKLEEKSGGRSGELRREGP
jgi:cyclic pyranopterin phosphate synthase